MTNKTWIGAAIFVLAVAAALVTLQLVRSGDGKPVLASEIVERATQVQTELLSAVRPDSTLHVVFVEHDPLKAGLPRGPGWNAVNAQKEWWAYFGQDGRMEAFRAESRDMESGELYRVVEWMDGELVTTFSTIGESSRVSFPSWTVEALRQQIIEGSNVALDKVVAGADDPALQAEADGRTVFVVEEVDTFGTEGVYIDAEDYRPLKVEILRDGEVVNTTAMPTFELLQGNHLPPREDGGPAEGELAD
ncbi:MAG: hypothetical protein WEC75_03840 [Dehalococcoidia bacterium]